MVSEVLTKAMLRGNGAPDRAVLSPVARVTLDLVPDGWAKINGQWVRLQRVGWHDPVMGLCDKPIDDEGGPVFMVLGQE